MNSREVRKEVLIRLMLFGIFAGVVLSYLFVFCNGGIA